MTEQVCNREISYFERKKQDPMKVPCILNKKGLPATVKGYRNLDMLRDSGLEYVSSNPVFNIVETSLYPEIHVAQTNENITYSFLYIISKYIGEQLFFKFGSGGNFKQTTQTLRLNRIEGAQTFLIPGVGNNVGFQVHFLIFFKKTPYLDKSAVHEFIEKSIHKTLQIQFKASNLRFGTENPSEWYLLRKPAGQSDDPKYFCGFIMDVLTTYANEADILAPNIIWKLSKNSKNTKKISLPSIEDAQKRLVMNNSIYYTILKMLDSKGIRSQRRFTVEIEEGDENTLRKRKGTVQMYRKEIIDKGDMIVENDAKVGSLLEFSGKKYVVTDIVLNRLKYSFGQPLETNEIYVKFRPYEKKDVSILDFKEQNIRIIPKHEKRTETGIEYSDYYMKIEDILRIIKPIESELNDWPLKENYDYYKMRREGKTYEVFEMANNVQLPEWYFAAKVQEFWSKVFIGSITNPKYKRYQEPHVDSRVNIESDQTQYEWRVIARTIYKNEDTSKRTNILLKRSTTNEPTIEEEVPVTRLMMLFNVIEHVQEKMITKPKFIHGDKGGIHYIIEKDFTCRLPAGYFDYDFEYNENVEKELFTYRVHKVYEKQIVQGDINIESVDYMDIGQIFPHSNYKSYHVPVSKFPEPKDIIVIGKSKLTKGSILSFNSTSLSKGVKPFKDRPLHMETIGRVQDVKGNKILYSLRDVKYLGIDSKRGSPDRQYIKVVSVLTEEENIYKLQYYPPYDKVKKWQFPYNGEKVEKTFEDNVNYKGVITNVEPLETVNGTPNIYSVVYEYDKQKEDLFLNEIEKVILNKKKKHENPNLSVFHYVYADDLDKYLNDKFFVVEDKSIIAKIFPPSSTRKTRKKMKTKDGTLKISRNKS